MVLSLENFFATPIQNLTKIEEFPLFSSCVSSTLTNRYELINHLFDIKICPVRMPSGFYFKAFSIPGKVRRRLRSRPRSCPSTTEDDWKESFGTFTPRRNWPQISATKIYSRVLELRKVTKMLLTVFIISDGFLNHSEGVLRG